MNTLVNTSIAHSSDDYGSNQTGKLNDSTSWLIYDGNNWINAAITLYASNGVITILSGNVIYIG